MRYHFNEQSNQSKARDAYNRSSPHAVKDSSEGKNNERMTCVTPRQTNRTIVKHEEERQDINVGNEEAQQRLVDDLEYRFLYQEIERIEQNFQSGSHDSDETTVSLTSKYNDEIEISPSMHVKLMRLIKAMLPNSTTEQKDSFIRDLFDMGIRVSPNCSTRLQIQPHSRMAKEAEPFLDFDVENFDEKNSVKNEEESIQQKPNKVVSAYTPHLGQDLNNAQLLDEYVEGSNSIIESMDEFDSSGFEKDTSFKQSVYINTQNTNSSDAVDARWDRLSKVATSSSDAIDIRWEQLRNKMLSSSSSEGSDSLTSKMEADIIQECVEVGLASSRTTCTFSSHDQQIEINGGQSSIPQRRDTVTSEQNEMQASMSDGNSSVAPSISPFMKNMHQIQMGEHPGQADETNLSMRNRPGQADNCSLDQPIQQQADETNLNMRNRPGQSDDCSLDQPIQHQADETNLNMRNRPGQSDDYSHYQPIQQQADETNRNRRGQADDCSLYQPIQQRNTTSDSFSIDDMHSSTANEKTERSNIPSFDEGPTSKSSLEGIVFVNIENAVSSGGSKQNEEEIQTLTDESRLTVSDSSDTENSKIIVDENAGDSTSIVIENESIDGSRRDLANVIYVKSSLTVLEESDQSFYKTVNLSGSDSLEKTASAEIPNSTPDAQPSWRLSPAESLSDFLLTVLTAETGTTANYYVHKHMMATGPKSSQYMTEVFATENTSKFLVTLDEKTSTLIPKILDFIYCHDRDVNITTDNAVALRQLATMLKIVPLEVKAANFILKDMAINNLVTYVSDCSYFNDVEVTKVIVEKCTANIGSIPVSDRLWIVMEPDLFLQIISSPCIDRGALSKHISVLLREYLDLHQYEIDVDLFVTLTSESIIPIVDRTAALALIELSDYYDSKECDELQKRCAFTVACYWQTTPKAERHRLFALLRNLPSSLTVDFLEIVESGSVAMEALRLEIEQQASSGNPFTDHEQEEALTVQDFCRDLEEEDYNKKTLSWRMDPEKSFSDMSIRVKYLIHEGSQIYHVHKHIVAVGANKSTFFAQYLNSSGIAAGQKVCIVIELDYEGASVVPQVLDFIYSRDSEIEISQEDSVAFNYVARAFGVSTLSKKVMEFIDQNISIENVADYIIEGGYYRDPMTIATAGRLCAQEIMSIGIESKLLKELSPDFFEMIVSCDMIEQTSKAYVNILITKYFSVHNLEGDVIEKLSKSIHVDQIDKHSALHLLKIVIKLKDYEGIETFETIKKKSVDVITENWTELTADNDRRGELFSIFPSLTSDLLTEMFQTVDSKTKKEHKDAMSQQAKLAKRFQEQAAEANRLREEEVSYLENELEVRTTKMLILQKELARKLERAMVNLGDQHEPAYGGIDGEGGMNMIGMEKIVEGSEHSDRSNEGKDEQEVDSDQESVGTAKIQKKKGRMCC